MKKLFLLLLASLVCHTSWAADAAIPSSTLDCSNFPDLSGVSTSSTGIGGTGSGYALLNANDTDADTLICSAAFLSYNTASVTWTTVASNSASNTSWDSKYFFKGRLFYNSAGNAKNVNIRNTTRTVAYRVKNCAQVAILGIGNGGSKYISVSATELDNDGNKTATVISGRNVNNSSMDSSRVTLDTSKEYYIFVQATTDDNAKLYEVAFISKTPSAACSTAPTITVAPSSATYCVGNTATALSFTGTGHNAQKWQYYDGDSWEDTGTTTATYSPSTSSTGSTQYRVVTTCDNYDTYYTASDAATITVKANHSVTAATSTGNNTYGTVAAASATVCEGSTTTVTATPATGYQVTNWAVSDDDNGAFISPSGASNSNTTTLTMGTADATVTVTFGCKAPTSPDISGTTAYTEGDNISLTAAATGTNASTTYTWYKGTDWATASASSPVQAASTSGATFTKASSVAGDAGTYWCKISNGSGCDVQTSKTITVGAACTDPNLTITLN